MGYIAINNFIHTPAAIFDLAGRCWRSSPDEGVPCRIRVGPRRFLNEWVRPQELRLVLWQSVDGQITYLPNEPVDAATDENGGLFIDAVTLAKKYFGKDVCVCSSEWWKWKKGLPFSDTFLTTDFGAACSHSVWLDINVTHSHLYFKPGTLTLEGHDVLSIYWETFCDELGVHSATMRPFAEALLREPHAILAEHFKTPLEQLELLKEHGFNHLNIRTNLGEYDLVSGLGASISVSLAHEGIVVHDYKPSPNASPVEDVDVLLQLMQADSVRQIRNTLESLSAQGLVCKSKR